LRFRPLASPCSRCLRPLRLLRLLRPLRPLRPLRSTCADRLRRCLMPRLFLFRLDFPSLAASK
jgi:hypothetical protein